MKKLTALEGIKAKDVVEPVAEELATKIQASAKSFSNQEWRYISKCETRSYGSSCFVDVGLKNDKAPFDSWKGLYFHNYGYKQYFYGHDLGYMETRHILWFTNAINGAKGEIISKLRARLKSEVRKRMGG